jgi:spermidine/putrescine-binding protein
MSGKSNSVNRRTAAKIIGGTVAGLVVGGAIGYLSRGAEVIERTAATTVTQTQVRTETVTVTGTAPVTTVTPPPVTTVTTPATTITELPAPAEYLAKFPNWEYYYSPTPRPRTLRYLGGAWMMYPEVAEFWEKVHKQRVEASYLDLFIMAQRIVATEGYGWDVAGTARLPPIKKAGIILPIPAEKLPRFDPNKVPQIFVHPERFLRPAQVPRFQYNLWFSEEDYTTYKNFALVPNNWNFDAITYLPEKLPYEEEGGNKFSFSYSELWNPEWKGRTMMQDEAFTVFSETANELEATGQITLSGANTNLTKEEVDRVYNFLLPIIKTGQIRTFWFKYGDAVNLLATREIWAGSTWQPICFDTRRAGTPAYYARLVNGPFFWFNGDIVSKYTPILEDVYKFIAFRTDIWWGAFITRNGYGTLTSNYDDVRAYMGAEFFDWVNNGQRTYLPINEIIKNWCFPERPELWNLEDRLLHALFLPDKYFPPGEKPREGKPHPRGNLRDLGSIEDKQKITRYFLSSDLPDEVDYYTEKYNDLKAQLPV